MQITWFHSQSTLHACKRVDKLYAFVLFRSVCCFHFSRTMVKRQKGYFIFFIGLDIPRIRIRKGMFRGNFSIIEIECLLNGLVLLSISLFVHILNVRKTYAKQPFCLYLKNLTFYYNSLQFHTLKMPLSAVSISMYVYMLLNNLGCIIWHAEEGSDHLHE